MRAEAASRSSFEAAAEERASGADVYFGVRLTGSPTRTRCTISRGCTRKPRGAEGDLAESLGVPAGWKGARGALRVSISQEEPVSISFMAGGPGLKIVTADVAYGP